MPLRIFNVLGREKQDFVPLEAGRVGMYVCGPTVYDESHIGHAKTYISFDVVVRYLRYSGYNVLYVQNLTDVGHLLDTGEDRILRKAAQTQSKPMADRRALRPRLSGCDGSARRDAPGYLAARQRAHPRTDQDDRDAARKRSAPTRSTAASIST